MKTLSVRNPLSYLICAGIKDVENRTWTTKYRGRLLIHSCGDDNRFCFEDRDYPASILSDREAGRKNKYTAAMDKITKLLDRFYGCKLADEFFALMADHERLDKTKPYLRRLAIIGEATLADVVRDSKSPFAEKGVFHWILTEPVLYAYDNVIPLVKGKLGLWNYTKEV